MLNILAVAVLVFTTVKIAFSILQWIVEKDGDKILRGKLDAVFDKIDKLSFRQISNRSLRQTEQAFRSILILTPKSLKKFVLASFALNALSYIFASWVFCTLRRDCGLSLGHAEVLSRPDGLRELSLWLTIALLLYIVVQFVSLAVSWQMLRIAAVKSTPISLVVHLLVASLLVIITIGVVYAAQQIATYFAFREGPHWEKVIPNILNFTPYFAATLILALVASAPTVVYVLLLMASLLIRFMPNGVRLLLIWIVFKVTTDSTPVIERMGSVAGGVASFGSALAAYLKSG